MMSTGLNFRYPRATFTEPLPYGYIYVGMTVDPPKRAPFVRESSRRDGVLEECKVLARRLEDLGEVNQVTVYEAVLIPPLRDMPRFDVILLIQTTSPAEIPAVQTSEPYRKLNADFVMTARNTRRIGETENTLAGTFLFNHFAAEDPENAVEVWENLTGWYTDKLGVDNSTLLQPIRISESPYAFVNYVRLPGGPIRFMLEQFVRPSFTTFVRASLRRNSITALPVLCRVVKRV